MSGMVRKIGIFLSFLSVSLQIGAVGLQKRFTLMGMGDSITEGADYFSCYLYPLWQKLYEAGYDFDFIGPRESECRIGSLPHCGFSGHTVEFLAEKADSLYRLYPADIVLLHAGHNHFEEEKPIDGMIAAYRSIIGTIQRINPEARILLAQVIPSGKLPKYAYIPELNCRIAELVAGLKTDRVLLVDQAEGFDWKMQTIGDHVHPNASGAERMAAVWFKALRSILGVPPFSYSPDIVNYKVTERGDSLALHVFKPDNLHCGGLRPAIVFFFGGGWIIGSPYQYYKECAYYVSLGMVAVAVDYRIERLHGSTVFDSFEDAKDAMRWLRAHAEEFHIDSQRIAVAGGSAGGHLAAALGTIGCAESAVADYCPNLLVLYYPVVDNGPSGYGSVEMKARYKEISPMHNICPGTPPSLFIVGTKDDLVPVETAEAFCGKMEQNGVECELHLFEGAGHPIFSYRKPLDGNFYKIRDLTDAFLKKHGFLPCPW